MGRAPGTGGDGVVAALDKWAPDFHAMDTPTDLEDESLTGAGWNEGYRANTYLPKVMRERGGFGKDLPKRNDLRPDGYPFSTMEAPPEMGGMGGYYGRQYRH